VSRDFSPLVLFVKQNLLVPAGMPRKDFKYLKILVELFDFTMLVGIKNTGGAKGFSVVG
jgi:hypothetical protein